MINTRKFSDCLFAIIEAEVAWYTRYTHSSGSRNNINKKEHQQQRQNHHHPHHHHRLQEQQQPQQLNINACATPKIRSTAKVGARAPTYVCDAICLPSGFLPEAYPQKGKRKQRKGEISRLEKVIQRRGLNNFDRLVANDENDDDGESYLSEGRLFRLLYVRLNCIPGHHVTSPP